MKAKITRGNTKLGRIPNISLTPIRSCMPRAPCAKLCYAMKSQRQYPETRACRAWNLRAYRTTPEAYFGSIVDRAARLQFFRWHVAGDIVDRRYLDGMIAVANACLGTAFLCFTKRYDIVNVKLDELATNHLLGRHPVGLPKNLTVIFSAWPGLPMLNPYAVPVAYMIPRDGEETRIIGTEIQCPGNCETCAMCWSLPSLGVNVVFPQH